MGMNGFTGVVETGSNAPANMASTLLEIYLNEMYQNVELVEFVRCETFFRDKGRYLGEGNNSVLFTVC